MADLHGFTRDLMCQMELDLNTRLDWIAVDHHNTGHPHTHIIVRDALDDGRILNIAGDYIAYAIRHRASDLVTRLEPGRWVVSDSAEVTLKELGERNAVIKSTHRALATNGLGEERGVANSLGW